MKTKSQLKAQALNKAAERERRTAEGLKRWECWGTPEQIKLLKDDLLFYRLHGGKVKGSSVQARHK